MAKEKSYDQTNPFLVKLDFLKNAFEESFKKGGAPLGVSEKAFLQQFMMFAEVIEVQMDKDIDESTKRVKFEEYESLRVA